MSQERKHIFIDRSLWSHRWFDDLPIEYQMAYLILWADSDRVGIWKPHYRELYFKLKQEIDPEEFLSQINEDRELIKTLGNGDWWLLEYLPLQVGTLTPTNRPHVSYIEDLRAHGLLIDYARRNPDRVKFDVIYDLEKHEEIDNIDEKKKSRAAFKYLNYKGLVRPLQEACEALARSTQAPKEKEKEKEKEQEQEQEEDKDQEKDLDLNTNNGAKTNPDYFGEPSL